MTGGSQNRLYYGANLDVLHRYVKDESVDLIYLDPPFNSDQNYKVLFAEHARPVDQKKGADKGIGGRLYFHDEKAGGKTKSVIFSVKAGKVNVAHVRDLRGVLDREDAEVGALISLREPTKEMRSEAASAGHYKSPGWNKNYPHIQLITVGELLDRKSIELPPGEFVTFKGAERAARTATE